MYSHVKSAWAAALRSGKFKQIIGCERYTPESGDAKPRYCAFGVLVAIAEEKLGPLTCQLSAPKPRRVKEEDPLDNAGEAMIGVEEWAKFEKWAGGTRMRDFNSPDGSIIKLAVEANDAGKTFEEIAGMVEG